MDFWEAQRRAKSKTKVYLAIFVAMTLLIAFCLELAMRSYAGREYQGSPPYLALLFLGVTFGVAFFQYSMYQSFGGSYVARSVGGRLVDPNTNDPKERQLLNIAHEVALAASLPMPPIFILDADQINAFAAGLTPRNAAIAITRGALHKLSREEVQGVIAHEFGHIYNGDMKISLNLAAMVMGFFFILYLAFRLISFASIAGGGRRDERGKGGNPILIAALLLVAAGAISWFFGSILKAMVSREREYLADACAVQFTRYPQGIANALRKIAADQTNDMPKEGMAYSHMYLDNHVGFNSLFATHPPLKKRIEAIAKMAYMPKEWLEEWNGKKTGE